MRRKKYTIEAQKRFIGTLMTHLKKRNDEIQTLKEIVADTEARLNSNMGMADCVIQARDKSIADLREKLANKGAPTLRFTRQEPCEGSTMTDADYGRLTACFGPKYIGEILTTEVGTYKVFLRIHTRLRWLAVPPHFDSEEEARGWLEANIDNLLKNHTFGLQGQV